MPLRRAPTRQYAVVDLDGVVADVRHRLAHLEQRPRDWTAFFSAAPGDPVLDEGAAVVTTLADAYDLVWLTGRPERCRAETLRWLAGSALPAGRLIMRREGDRRPAGVLKVEVLRQLTRTQPVAVVVDDDEQVAQAVEAAGFLAYRADWMTRPGLLGHVQEREGRT